MRTAIVLAAALVIAGCSATGRAYTDNEHYYTDNGIFWSCRNAGEPGKDGTVKPGGAYFGGNCRPESEWRR